MTILSFWMFLLHFALIFFYIALALFVYKYVRRSSYSKAFVFFLIIQSFWILSLFLGYYFASTNYLLSFVSFRISYGLSFWLAVSFLIFTYYFPTILFSFSKILKWIFWIFVTVWTFALVFTNAVFVEMVFDSSGVYVSDIFGAFFPMYTYVFLIFLFLIFFFLIKKIFILKGVERTKVLIVFLGYLLTGISMFILNVVLAMFKIYNVQITIATSLFLIVLSFYSISRFRFLNISNYAFNILRKFLLFLIFVLLTLFLNFSFKSFFPEFEHYFEFYLLLISGIVYFLLTALRNFIPVLENKDLKLFNEKMNYLYLKLPYIDDFYRLNFLIEDVFVKQLGLGSVHLFVVRNSDLSNSLINVYKRDDFTKSFSKFNSDIFVFKELDYYLIEDDEREMYTKILSKYSSELCLRLFSDKKMIGLLFLGEKSESGVFTKLELDKILSLKSILEIVLMNILVKQNLQEENDLMKDIIDKKTKKLRKQFIEIKDLLRQQTDFLAVTAHEFRTPLSIALFQLEDTLENYKHAPDVLSEMKTIESSLMNLKNLTQRLFDVQQYDLDKVVLNLDLLKISDFVYDVYMDFKLFTNEKKIQNKKVLFDNYLSTDLIIDIDKNRIRQVLNNVLTNALKFADKIKITLNDDEKNLYIFIDDNGPGIEEKDRKRVFKKFQTTQTSMVLGIGLGLYLCKKIMDLHKGNIWVEDSEMGGARFVIKFLK